MEKFNPAALIKLYKIFLDYMLTRKTVAQFTDFDNAKSDVIMELKNMVTDDPGAVERAINIFEKETKLREWWDEI